MPKKQSENTPQETPILGNYLVPAAESHLYHVLQEKTKFDPTTGERLSAPFVQKYGRREFESFIKRRLEGQGWKLTILHDPSVPQAPAAPASETPVREEE